jgi:hypothetical protein
MTIEIELTQGKKAIIDDQDYEAVSKHKWCVNTGYASTRTGDKQVLLHRFILSAPSNMDVDHINMDRLDCRRSNLRVCTRSENMANRPPYKNNKTGFKGVRWMADRNKYRAEIRHQKKQQHLGNFDDPVDAAKAYDKAARELFGDFARTNFK